MTPNDVTNSIGRTLQCSVTSIQEHGYVVGFGVAGTSGFLKKKHAETYLKQTGKDAFYIGQPFFCSLLAKFEEAGQVIKITADPAHVASSYAKRVAKLAMSDLAPGLLVDAEVQEVSEEYNCTPARLPEDAHG